MLGRDVVDSAASWGIFEVGPKVATTLWQKAACAGDGALLLTFGQHMDPQVNDLVHRVGAAVRAAALPGVWGIVAAYTTLLIEYDPLVTDDQEVLARVRQLPVADDQRTPRCFVLPVLYGGEAGPDLPSVATALGLGPDEVVALHTASPYRIYCLGFSPGFPLCGILPAALSVPRRSSPRTVVPAGSVAIAGSQTGVYPTETPGGWHLLGKTPLSLFTLQRDPPILYQPGDSLWFRAIDANEFARLTELARTGRAMIEEMPRGSD